MITYRQLLAKLQECPPEHLDDNVTVLCMGADEVYPVMDFVSAGWKTIHELENQDAAYQSFGIDQVSGVLDEGHPYLTIYG